MRINQDFIMVVMAGAGLLLVLALCMAALYKWISFLGGKMTGYGMHIHQMLKQMSQMMKMKIRETDYGQVQRSGIKKARLCKSCI